MLWKLFTNIYTANEEAVLKSILLVSLDNSSTLLFILDNSGLKIGNCCWLVLLSMFPARLFTKNFNGQEVVKLLPLPSITLQLVEKSVQISSHLLICVCTFLLLYKIVYGFPNFADAWLSFYIIRRFQIFRIIKFAPWIFVFLVLIVSSVKNQSFR